MRPHSAPHAPRSRASRSPRVPGTRDSDDGSIAPETRAPPLLSTPRRRSDVHRLGRARAPFLTLSSPPLPPPHLFLAPLSGRIPSAASFGNLSEASAQSAEDADDRAPDEIARAKERVLELDHAPFVAAVLDGTASTTAVFAALGDACDEVREAALSVARAAVSGDAAEGRADALASSLAAAVDAFASSPPQSPDPDSQHS